MVVGASSLFIRYRPEHVPGFKEKRQYAMPIVISILKRAFAQGFFFLDIQRVDTRHGKILIEQDCRPEGNG
jgi:hypothetical protein